HPCSRLFVSNNKVFSPPHSATSTFWIANPNNNLINCAAAGSEETGFWFIFHHVPTGPSEGLYSPGRTEHTPMGQFTNNRAHSNYRAGMILDNGVKTTEANDKDKRPFLSLIGARYGPHQDADPFKPRVPALIHHFVAYKNQDHGAWLRGGDVWLDDCQFADNGIGLTLASGGTFPDDDGSRQQVINSLLWVRVRTAGCPSLTTGSGAPGGPTTAAERCLVALIFQSEACRSTTGPINIQNCTFRKYVALDERHTSAFGFRLNNSWQSCPNNKPPYIPGRAGHVLGLVPMLRTWYRLQVVLPSVVPFQALITSRVFFGEPGPWFSKMQMDGDKTTIFHDMDGSVSEYPGAFLVKEDTGCCGTPTGIDVPDGRLPSAAAATPRNDWINVGLCYPQGHHFHRHRDIHHRLTSSPQTGVFMRTRRWTRSTLPAGPRILLLGGGHWVKAHSEREPFAFCSAKGCERVKITAGIPKGSPPSNCMAQAYPRHAEMPVVDVPMPRKIPNARLQSPEHFLEVLLESYSTRFFHIKEDFAFTEVNGKKMYQPEDGVQLTVIDGHDGKLVENKSFRNSILQGIPAQIDNYVSGLRDGSIVLITSKGRLLTRGPWTKVLERLGADKSIKLKDKMAFVGFKGSFHPDWIRMEVNSERAKIHQVLPIPVVHKMKL
ncbi:hypothetical protein KUCAC02_001749, partial [Chaenocephalus aceratus]